jgi:hypothetical protein
VNVAKKQKCKITHFLTSNSGTAAAALLGGTTVAAYLDAKFHIKKDVKAVLTLRQGEREYASAGRSSHELA